MSVLDDLMPRFDVRTRHERRVAAGAARVWDALESFNVAADASTVTKALLLLRGLRPPSGGGIGAVAGSRFTPVHVEPEKALALAIAGRFWAVRETRALDRLETAADALGYDRPGRAVAMWSFEIGPAGDAASCLLSTETRVRCVDEEARRSFMRYWRLIAPFSGVIRKDLLRAIARRAERS